MNDRNEVSKLHYAFFNVFWGAFGIYCFYITMFLRWPNQSILTSKIIFFSLLFIFIIAGFSITMKRRRNDVSIAINVLLPLEIYAFVTFFAFYKHAIITLGIISASLALAFSIAVICRCQRKKENRVSVWKQIRHCILGSRTIIVSCMATLLCVIFFSCLFGDNILTSNVSFSESDMSQSDVYEEVSGPWTIANNIDTIMLLEEDNWGKLSPEEKLDVLGVVKNIEIQYLGINHDIALVCGVTDVNLDGSYNSDEAVITLNACELTTSTAHDVVNTICHECYHAYERQMISLYNDTAAEYRNMLLFKPALTYSKEFENYVQADENFYNYFCMQVEADSRKYAAEGVEDYYKKIEMYKPEPNDSN